MRLKTFLARLEMIRAVFGDTRTPAVSKILPWIAIIYFLWPADLAPDVIPLIGQLDDIGIAALLFFLSWEFIAKTVKEDHLKKMSKKGSPL